MDSQDGSARLGGFTATHYGGNVFIPVGHSQGLYMRRLSGIEQPSITDRLQQKIGELKFMFHPLFVVDLNYLARDDEPSQSAHPIGMPFTA